MNTSFGSNGSGSNAGQQSPFADALYLWERER